MNQARKSDFKTRVKKKNPNSKTDSSHKTLYSILYWKLVFKPFPNESFGWCNAHSVQASAHWGRSFKFQMTNTPQNQYFPANVERMALEISLGRGFCPPRPERLPEGEARGQSRGPSILSALAGKYWFCGVFLIWNLKDLPHSALACTEWALHYPKISVGKSLKTKN